MVRTNAFGECENKLRDTPGCSQWNSLADTRDFNGNRCTSAAFGARASPAPTPTWTKVTYLELNAAPDPAKSGNFLISTRRHARTSIINNKHHHFALCAAFGQRCSWDSLLCQLGWRSGRPGGSAGGATIARPLLPTEWALANHRWRNDQPANQSAGIVKIT